MTDQARTQYTEPYRPQYHFSPQANWINDPNGLVYFEGEYHLFYQYHPYNTVWGPMHWGHAVSRDLVHWTHLPTALYPDKIGEIWSGSAVVDSVNTSGLVPGGGLVAMFSYTDQSQGLAYSQDSGRTWVNYAGNPVIPAGGKDFRDPKVFWYEPARHWVMILAAGDRAKLYTSPNLLYWTHESEVRPEHGPHNSLWECTDLFPLDVREKTKWVLVVSVTGGGPFGGRGTFYLVGSFDGRAFTNETPTPLWLDYGPDNYAGVTYNNAPDHQRIFIGWMNNWTYAKDIPTGTWRGAMTIPRRLDLKQSRDGFRLVQFPVAQVESLRGTPKSWRNETISADENLLEGITGRMLDIVAEFEPGSARTVEFQVLKGQDQCTVIAYETRSGTLSVDRTRSGNVAFHTEFVGIHRAALSPVDGRIKLRILVDWSSVEVFANDGEVAMTTQVFPDESSDQLALVTTGIDAQLISLDVYPMRRIWG